MRFRFVTLLMLTSILAACSATYQGSRTSPSESSLRPGDVVEIRFARYASFDQTLVVHPDGKISLRALGDIAVLGVPPTSLEELIRQKYDTVLNQPEITVQIIRASNLQIYLGGDLLKPGVVQFDGNLSITQAILLAGGLKDTAKDYDVVVFRKQGKSGMKIHRFELEADGQGDRAVSSFMLAPYDVVFVTQSVFDQKGRKTLI